MAHKKKKKTEGAFLGRGRTTRVVSNDLIGPGLRNFKRPIVKVEKKGRKKKS